MKPERRRRWLANAAALTAVAAVAVAIIFWLPPRDDRSLPAFREQMVSKALRTYGMDLETDKLDQVRAFLTKRKAHGNFDLPPGLQQGVKLTGCATILWHGQTVSMICFESGHPRPPGTSASDLWLFVADSKPLGLPPDTAPSFSKVNTATTATWTQASKVYVLVTEADAQFLQRYL